MNDAKMTPDQLRIEVLKAMGWTNVIDSPCRQGLLGCAPGEKDLGLRSPPPLTLDLMWQAIHPDKPLAEEITRQAKEFLKLQQ